MCGGGPPEQQAYLQGRKMSLQPKGAKQSRAQLQPVTKAFEENRADQTKPRRLISLMVYNWTREVIRLPELRLGALCCKTRLWTLEIAGACPEVSKRKTYVDIRTP